MGKIKVILIMINWVFLVAALIIGGSIIVHYLFSTIGLVVSGITFTLSEIVFFCWLLESVPMMED